MSVKRMLLYGTKSLPVDGSALWQR